MANLRAVLDSQQRSSVSVPRKAAEKPKFRARYELEFFGSQEVPTAKKEALENSLKAMVRKKKSTGGMPGTLTVTTEGITWVKVGKSSGAVYGIHRVLFSSAVDIGPYFGFIVKDQKGNRFVCNCFKCNDMKQADDVNQSIGKAFRLAFEQSSHTGPSVGQSFEHRVNSNTVTTLSKLDKGKGIDANEAMAMVEAGFSSMGWSHPSPAVREEVGKPVYTRIPGTSRGVWVAPKTGLVSETSNKSQVKGKELKTNMPVPPPRMKAKKREVPVDKPQPVEEDSDLAEAIKRSLVDHQREEALRERARSFTDNQTATNPFLNPALTPPLPIKNPSVPKNRTNMAPNGPSSNPFLTESPPEKVQHSLKSSVNGNTKDHDQKTALPPPNTQPNALSEALKALASSIEEGEVRARSGSNASSRRLRERSSSQNSNASHSSFQPQQVESKLRISESSSNNKAAKEPPISPTEQGPAEAQLIDLSSPPRVTKETQGSPRQTEYETNNNPMLDMFSPQAQGAEINKFDEPKPTIQAHVQPPAAHMIASQVANPSVLSNEVLTNSTLGESSNVCTEETVQVIIPVQNETGEAGDESEQEETKLLVNGENFSENILAAEKEPEAFAEPSTLRNDSMMKIPELPSSNETRPTMAKESGLLPSQQIAGPTNDLAGAVTNSKSSDILNRQEEEVILMENAMKELQKRLALETEMEVDESEESSDISKDDADKSQASDEGAEADDSTHDPDIEAMLAGLKKELGIEIPESVATVVDTPTTTTEASYSQPKRDNIFISRPSPVTEIKSDIPKSHNQTQLWNTVRKPKHIVVETREDEQEVIVEDFTVGGKFGVTDQGGLRFTKVQDLYPDIAGVNLKIKVLRCIVRIKNRELGVDISECLVADDTASIVLQVTGGVSDKIKPGMHLTVFNASISLVKGTMRLLLGKFSTIKTSTSEVKSESLSWRVPSGNMSNVFVQAGG
eukprot:m.152835 g.152835  ORF g.152835 m.152835 type:complete len:964 (+) comp15057_c0_seq10:239-3130(+)